MQHLEFRRVSVIAARHSQLAQDELWEERQIKSDEEDQRRDSTQSFRIYSARDLRPPVVQSAKETDHRAAHHDVVEVRDDEVGVLQVNVQSQRGQEQSGHSAYGKQPQEG